MKEKAKKSYNEAASIWWTEQIRKSKGYSSDLDENVTRFQNLLDIKIVEQMTETEAMILYTDNKPEGLLGEVASLAKVSSELFDSQKAMWISKNEIKLWDVKKQTIKNIL